MKKIALMLVTMFVVLVANGQIISEVNASRMEFRVGNAWYSCADLPGGAHAAKGDYVMTLVRDHFAHLSHDDPEEYQRQLNAWTLSGGLAGVTPVRYSTAVMGGGAMMGGMVGGMVGGGNAYIGGNLGMAPAQSNLYVDNNNAGEMLGTGLYGSYDSATNNFTVSGDLGGVVRLGRSVANLFKGSGSKKFKGQIVQDANGNQYVVNNGVLVPVRQQTTRNQQVQPQTNNYNGGVATQPVYNVASGY